MFIQIENTLINVNQIVFTEYKPEYTEEAHICEETLEDIPETTYLSELKIYTTALEKEDSYGWDGETIGTTATSIVHYFKGEVADETFERLQNI